MASTALASPALARDGAWYVGVEAGPMIVEDTDFDIGQTGDVTSVDYDYGFDAGGVVGYDFGPVRIEAEARYAEANGIQRVTDLDLRTQLIDDAVLSGPFIAAKDLQEALGVVVDGIIGPQTLAAITRDGAAVVGRRLVVERSLRLARHVQQHPDQLVFLVGWLSRALSFLR